MCRRIRLMGYQLSCSKCLTICLGLTFIMGCYLAIIPIENPPPLKTDPVSVYIRNITSRKKSLAIIVPFRDRFEELLEFVPHMHKFLNKQAIPFQIFVIQQKDNNRFNRASLINIGYLQTRTMHDYIAMHDVDLLPMNDNLKYAYPEKNPIHISSPETHPNYHYSTFIGGILLIRNKHFEDVKGMSNNYWGWGLEDDEFYVRLKDGGLQVQRPTGIRTGTEDTFKHIHDKSHRRRDHRKCYNQREVTRKRDTKTGVHDVAYKLLGTHKLTIDGFAATVINVELLCDQTVTPWCQCPSPSPKKQEAKVKS